MPTGGGCCCLDCARKNRVLANTAVAAIAAVVAATAAAAAAGAAATVAGATAGAHTAAAVVAAAVVAAAVVAAAERHNCPNASCLRPVRKQRQGVAPTCETVLCLCEKPAQLQMCVDFAQAAAMQML